MFNKIAVFLVSYSLSESGVMTLTDHSDSERHNLSVGDR